MVPEVYLHTNFVNHLDPSPPTKTFLKLLLTNIIRAPFNRTQKIKIITYFKNLTTGLYALYIYKAHIKFVLIDFYLLFNL